MKKAVVIIFLAISTGSYAQKNCSDVMRSSLYFSASATADIEEDARINALSMLSENISSVVSSKTDVITKGERQTYSSVSKATSVLHLKGVSYVTCDKSKKNGVTVMAYVSKKDLESSSTEVASRVHQYLQLAEQKESQHVDFLPDLYTAYLHTYLTPYPIEYNSDTRHIGNVRNYLQSYLRTYLANINMTCTGVRENPDYPEQQLKMTLSLAGAEGTNMKFVIDLPEYGARGSVDRDNNTMDIIMSPDGKITRFNGKLTLAPPPVEAELVDISDHVQISREVSFEADMSGIIRLDFTSQVVGDRVWLTPVVRHIAVRQFEWLSGGRLLSIERTPRLNVSGLKEITLRLNANDEFMVSKTMDGVIAPVDATWKVNNPAMNLAVDRIPVSEKDIQDTQMLLSNNSFDNDALVFVQSEIPDLTFNSSMSAIERQTYNSNVGRYELYVKPVKQLLFVGADGMVEKTMGIVNPQSGEVIGFVVKQVADDASFGKGFISIVSDPPDASIAINDVETAYKTPSTIALEGITKISIHKKYYFRYDTVIQVNANERTGLAVNLTRQVGNSNLSYLRLPHERTYYREMEQDPLAVQAQERQANYRRQSLSLRRKATLAYSTAALFIPMGLYYHWIDRLVYDKSTSSSHSSILKTFGDASYVIGGMGLVAGIIYSTKLSHLKKTWEIEPMAAPGAAGVSVTYHFK